MYYDDEQDYIPWSHPQGRTHPVLGALVVIALAIVAWHALAAYLHAHRAGAAETGSLTMPPGPGPVSVDPGRGPRARSSAETSPPADSTPGRPLGRRPVDSMSIRTDSASTVVATRASFGRAVSASASSSAPLPATGLTDRATGRPIEGKARHDAASASAAPADSGLGNVSPFLRTHPWAAVPGQPYYFRSNCPSTLRLRDLVFFRTEVQARAEGFKRAPPTECQ